MAWLSDVLQCLEMAIYTMVFNDVRCSPIGGSFGLVAAATLANALAI